MRVYYDIEDGDDLSNFKFWSGAADTASELNSKDFDRIQSNLEDMYPEGIEETTLNDIFWHDSETIEDWIGRSLYEEDEEFEESKKVSKKRTRESSVNTGEIDNIIERLGYSSEADNMLEYCLILIESITNDDDQILEAAVEYAKDELNQFQKYRERINNFSDDERAYFEQALESYVQDFIDQAKEVDLDEDEE
jgi:hypothetical protein